MVERDKKAGRREKDERADREIKRQRRSGLKAGVQQAPCRLSAPLSPA